ncbi:serine carboxypeptidase S28-domain-containing protein [Pisolithus orientalis]|uniref:serine carboxypeptidase S28-domain-containing protein n=1 Tax=Pisolithus orientalis TaxID=936130 RepID=UPI0022254CEF|nr:serine carboxypeptidase S28-domain-containing protein [Pisolithus orientalis]KAI6010844.1 serine carboxypeptidase S28-domain-containing protein [Pisolithus orientalis]
MALAFVVAALLAACAHAAVPNAMLRAVPALPPITAEEGLRTTPNGTTVPSLNTVYIFDQLIDHTNPSLGTFKQRYWMDWEYYKPGGPIIFMTPGEANAQNYTGYLTNSTINGLIAQQQNGATVLIEHRFFGLSNPYPNLSSQSLAFLTIQQAIDDLVYFAQQANLPMPGGDNVKPNTTPWILIGGSYSGALTAWTMVNRPGIFYAGYSSSGVVEAITNYWAYFKPIQEYMPQNCSADVQRVIAYLDGLYATNDTQKLQELKSAFGLGGLSHIDDFAAALQYNLFDWQELTPFIGPGAMFFQFCDALEVKDGQIAGPGGWGLENAIQSWGGFWNSTYYQHVCGDADAETCLGTYNVSQSYWTSTAINNNERSWFWVVCNQVGFYLGGPPVGQPAIASRILTPEYSERQCVNMFPQKFSSPPQPAAAQVDEEYEGWGVEVDRLFFANGQRDPWREVTVSSDFIYKSSTDTQPIYSGVVDASIARVQSAALGYMKTWLASWTPSWAVVANGTT